MTIIRTIEIDTEEHAIEFDKILGKLPYVKTLKVINEEAVALGRIQASSTAELTLFFTEDNEDEVLIAAEEVFSKYRN